MKKIKNFFKTIKASLSDVISTFALLAIFQMFITFALWLDTNLGIDLTNLVDFMKGVAQFATILFCVWLVGIGVTLPKTVSKFVVENFDEAWDLVGKDPDATESPARTKELQKKFKYVLCIAGSLGIIAALVFA